MAAEIDFGNTAYNSSPTKRIWKFWCATIHPVRASGTRSSIECSPISVPTGGANHCRAYEAIVQLIGSTTTKTGLKIEATLDDKNYETGRKVTDDEFAKINLTKGKTFSLWNYTIAPT